MADVYDAMSSNRVYQVAKNQFEILEEIYAEMFCRLDPQLSYVFLKNMKDLMIGCSVLLKSGTRGKLVLIDGIGRCRTMIQDDEGMCSWLDSPGTQIEEVS